LHHYTGGAPDAFGLDADFAQLTKDGPKASGVRPDRVSHRVTTSSRLISEIVSKPQSVSKGNSSGPLRPSNSKEIAPACAGSTGSS
jgi:hypothetical protein